MSLLFQRERSIITKHVNNVFKEGELKEKSNVQNLHGDVGLVHITKGNLERIEIPLPPLSIQKQIVEKIEAGGCWLILRRS